jgi:viologen exporter family transport system permease protein
VSDGIRRLAHLLRLVPLNEFTYRFEVFIFTIIVTGRIFLFVVLWHAVYRPGQVAAGMTVDQVVTYSTLAAVLTGHSDVASIVDSFTHRIREGTVAYLFVRPVGPLPYMLGLQMSGSLYRLAWLVVFAAVGVPLGVVAMPGDVAVLVWSVISLLLAEAVVIVLFQFVELLAFWTVETRDIRNAYAFVVQLLGGALVPLWFFPTWARVSLLALPFASAMSAPLSIFVGRIAVDQAPAVVASQIAWLVVLVWLLRTMWRGAERRVVVQGG